MKTTAYTAGPWTVTREGAGRNRYANIVDDAGDRIAFVYTETKRLPSGQANARLIAAAPELLEVLENIIDSGEIPYCESDKLVRVAKAAIAKARGRQQCEKGGE